MSTKKANAYQPISILDLPFVPMVQIFKYLSISDIRNCALTCRTFSTLAREPTLWKDLYPIHWTFGHNKYSDFVPQRKKKLSSQKHPNLSHRHWQVGYNMVITWLWDIVEYNLLSGMLEHLIPVVGDSVRELNLSNSSCLHDSMLRAMLVQCPNLLTLAVKRTGITAAAFTRLSDYGACQRLRNLNVSLTRANASTMTSLVECWIDRDELLPQVVATEEPLQVFYINGDDYQLTSENSNVWGCVDQFEAAQVALEEDQITTILFPNIPTRRRGKVSGLKSLDMSGCPVDDSALSVLKNCQPLVENLEWLDVSGCLLLTPEAISDFVLSCPLLQPENLFYCSYLNNGPYAEETNGCSKLSKHSCCDQTK